ncbi:MAG: hypothetical protein HYY76_14380 [Acidobacteria bacterium]|nr:hypothetical protein [Acidobacteriota bacterium]
MTRILLLAAASAVAASTALGQTPQPFPRPGGAPPAEAPAQAPAPQPPVQAPAAPAASAADPNAPTAATLGLPLYPSAQFIASYDAGRAQRYYIFGATASFADLVTYYRSVLKERGDLVFEQPPTHMFEVGRFRQETMAFPPGVTVKDWTWGGSAGYPNPRPGAQPARFPTIIMIVPPPPGASR